jgi:hypothetical protein
VTFAERGLWLITSTTVVLMALLWRQEHAERDAYNRAFDLVREHFDTHEPLGVVATEGW